MSSTQPVPTSRRQAKDDLFEGFSRISSAFASGRRAEIIELLAQAERTVEQIADEIGQSVANTSHHLRTLARAGLVATRRQGTHIHYRLASDGVLDAWLALRRLAAHQIEDIDHLARTYLGHREGVEVIDSRQLAERLERGEVVLIDVRPEVEYLAGHLPGAVSILPDRLDDLDDLVSDLPADRHIVAYCRGPFCVYADDAIRHLQARGHRASRLVDSVPEWRRAGGLVEEGRLHAGDRTEGGVRSGDGAASPERSEP